MDLLGDYGNSDTDGSEPEDNAKPSAQQPSQKTINQPTIKLPPPDFSSGLPPPSFDDEEPSIPINHASYGQKRGHQQVTGAALSKAPGPSKTSKSTASQTPKQPTLSASMLPPQLRGRSNVATEDLDRLFTKKSLGGKKKGADDPLQDQSGS